MPTRAQVVAAINSFRGRTPTNPIDDDELANFMQGWLDYYDQNGVWNPADVQTLIAQNSNLQSGFVARSLGLTATIYVDGINGNDARTGVTNDNNAATGRVKTIWRAAQLHSGKTNALNIVIAGSVDHALYTYLDCPYVSISIEAGATLRFKKYTTANVGDGTSTLICKSSTVYVYIKTGGTLDVEGHAGTTGVGDQFFYRNQQGALALGSLISDCIYSGELQTITLRNAGTFTIGNNAVFAVTGQNGLNQYGSVKASYRRGYGSAPTLGTNAVESDLIGDRTFLRSYHPTSSTDAKVMEGETVISPTNNKLWTKRGGTIRDAMGTTFA